MWVYERFEIIEKEFDTYTAFYQCRSTVVSIVLSCAYFELLDVEEYRTLKSGVDKAVRSQATSEPTERPLSCTARSALHVQCSCRHAICAYTHIGCFARSFRQHSVLRCWFYADCLWIFELRCMTCICHIFVLFD